MREAEKREFKAQEMINELVKKARSDFGDTSVTTHKEEDGSTIIRISNAVSTVSRKEHGLPEHLRKQGD